MTKSAIFILTAALWVPLVTAQDQDMRPDPENPVGENLQIPPDWEIRLDRPKDDFLLTSNPDSTDIWFVNMTPGWHITAGPSAIYYHPANVAEGDYTASADINLFDPEGRNEGFGILVGGKNLDADNQSYLYFLLRNDQKFLIKQRSGSDTSVLADWTESDVIVPFVAEAGNSSALNTLSVSVSGDTVSFTVNGTTVHEMPRGEIDTDGLVGLRINHGLNVHVSDLAVTTDT